jgi:type I restriction enzyme R subunit
VGTKLVGIIEAKAEHKDIPSVIDYQGKDYPRNIRKEDAEYQIGTWGEFKFPFTFATNGRPYLEQLPCKKKIAYCCVRCRCNSPTIDNNLSMFKITCSCDIRNTFASVIVSIRS